MSCEKHDPPRSLRGNQDADEIWSMITERFPTAAPLLCEMEEIIDRAKDLLQQLKPSQHHDIESSESPESGESLSLLSARGSFEERNEFNDEGDTKLYVKQNIATTQVSESNIDVMPRKLSQESIESEIICASSTSETTSTDRSITKNDSDHVSGETYSYGSSRNINYEAGDQRIDSCENDSQTPSLQGCEYKAVLKFEGQRTPLALIEAYSQRCDVPIDYQYANDVSHKYKSNVIRGNLGGFTAMSRGDTEDHAKNCVAMKILSMIADQQMNDEKVTPLLDLEKDELVEIIKFGGILDSPQINLYKLCLEKDVEVPRYFIEKDRTYQGLSYIATCKALGFEAEGRGLRKCVAKKAAAGELYRRYLQSLNPGSQEA